MGPRTIRTRCGFAMRLDLRDWVDQFIYATGIYEEPTAHLIAQLLQPGSTFVDVGANIGFFSLLAARIVGEKGRVLAFEPGPSQRKRLLTNIALNGLKNLSVAEQALSDVSEYVTLHLGPPNHSGISSLRTISPDLPSIIVQSLRLDDWWDETLPLHLVKLDVEGAEGKVLRGMASCIRRWRPDVVMEVTDEYLRQCGDSASDVCDWMRGHGYRMYMIDQCGIVPLPSWSHELPGQFNAWFTQRAVIPDSLHVKAGVCSTLE